MRDRSTERALEIVAGHEGIDFDCLAAMVAVSRLRSGTVLGLGRAMDRAVHDYWALHKDRFEAVLIERVEPSRVSRLTVVDVRDRSRLRHLEPILARADRGEVALRVYDHHPPTQNDLAGGIQTVEPVGAVTTLLVETIRHRGTTVDAADATLFALGIYADTGALTLGGTTPRDVRAVAWLLERGASLAVVDRYLSPPFSRDQRGALEQLLRGVRTVEIGGLPIGVAILHHDRHVEGLAEVISEARRLGSHAALFALAVVGGKKVEVIARAATPLVDVGAALRAIGGGGHRGAASAVVKHGDPDALVERLLDELRSHPSRPRVVAEVMSAPVRTVEPELALRDLEPLLDAWGHHGAPVVSDGALRGVISRRDVARARDADRLALPVSSHMSGHVITTAPDTPVEAALARMVEHDVGRLPVVRHGDSSEAALVGIVTRSDLLAVLYSDSASDTRVERSHGSTRHTASAHDPRHREEPGPRREAPKRSG